MEKLTLEHIAPYLPYGVKFKYDEEFVSPQFRTLEPPTIDFLMNNGKPVLYPLSELDKEFKHISYTKQLEPNLDKIIPNELFKKHWFTKIRDDGHFSTDEGDGTATGYQWRSCRIDIIFLLSEWKFDFMGLIEKGLAIDVNTLETNPYN